MSRTPAHAVEPFIVNRWSSRAMSGQALDRATLSRLFEAARWAPSWGNSQPWRFVLATKGTPAFDKLFQTLDEGNQAWATRAAALILVCSTKERANGKPLPTHAFDAGAAWMALALQGSAMGLVVHAMGGFDPPRAREAASVPEGVAVHCVVAVGKPGDPALLPEHQQAKEQPNDREPIELHVVEGAFPAS